MKKFKNVITFLVVVCLLIAAVPIAFAANDAEGKAGETVEVTFRFENVFNVDGVFSVSDPEKIVSDYTIQIANAGSTLATVSGNYLWAAPGGEPVSTNVVVSVKITLKKSATAGAACTVEFSGIYGDGNGTPGNEKDVSMKRVVTVKKADPGPQASESPTVTTDYAELEQQLDIVKALNEADYTGSSWSVVSEAWSNARSALNSTDQSRVDSAAAELEAAIAALVPMDYSALEDALAQVESFTKSEQFAEHWKKLLETAESVKGLIGCGDQFAVDTAAKTISDMLAQIQSELEELGEEVVVEVPVEIPVEVPVEVPPEGDYCNISSHRTWPILFFVSLALNVALAAIMVAYAFKKRHQRDDTPLVDYDIEDDMFI